MPDAAAEATLGNLNLLEFTREDTRWQRPHRIVEDDGVMLFAGSVDFPAYSNGAHRADPSVPGARVVEKAQAFFADLGRGFSIWTRIDPADDDLAAAADAAGIQVFADSPQMICRRRLPDRELPPGVEIRMVTDRRGVDDYADVTGEAYVSLGAPEDVNRSHFGGPAALQAPHVHAAVAYLDGRAAGAALVLMSHGIGGVYWVGCREEARRRGVAEAVTRHVTNLGFDLGAQSVQLQASTMGEPIYRRMGYEELERRQFRLAPPPT